MKTILLLGGYGFIGTNIIKYIDSYLPSQYNVIVFDRVPFHPYGVNFKSVVKSYVGDISNKCLLEQVFIENKIDIIIHSFSTTIPSADINPRFDVEQNLFPTLDVMDNMVKYKIKNIIYLSSGGAIYGMQGFRRHKESDDVFPISSYGVVKHTIEKYIMQYAYIYGIRPLILRLSNPYGPYHYNMRQGVINIALNKAINGEIMQVWGDGNGKKDYVYIEDFVRILFALLDIGCYDQVINIGSGKLYTVNDIVKAVKLLFPRLEIVYDNGSRYDVQNFELDTSKLHDLIGNYNFTSLNEGIQKTCEWIKQYDKE